MEIYSKSINPYSKPKKIHYRRSYIFLKLLIMISSGNNHGLYSIEETISPICVSLGSHCLPAWHFQKVGLRQEAFPFDWSLCSNINSIFQVLETDFKDFFSKDYLVNLRSTEVLDSLYGITYIHDFPTETVNVNGKKNKQLKKDWLLSYQEVYEKYHRRIERFRNLKNAKNPIYFFRFSHTSKKEAIKLKELLDNYFSPARTILVVVSGIEEYKTDWEIPTIKNIYHDHTIKGANYMWSTDFFMELCKQIPIKIAKFVTKNKSLISLKIVEEYLEENKLLMQIDI